MTMEIKRRSKGQDYNIGFYRRTNTNYYTSRCNTFIVCKECRNGLQRKIEVKMVGA